MPLTRDQVGQGGADSNLPVILIDGAKDELRTLAQDYKMLARKFKSQYKLVAHKDDIAADVSSYHTTQHTHTGAPKNFMRTAYVCTVYTIAY